MKSRYPYPTLLLALLIGSVTLITPPILSATRESDTLRKLVAFSPREGLPNFFNKLNQNKDITIAYFGGSITEQKGWRVQSLAWFQKQYPEGKIKEVNAAIGGTGSSLGVFRVAKDVLSHNPDLVFVEFAVNDANTGSSTILKAMEGIVRQIWKSAPKTDICFVYTITHKDSENLANGQMKRSTSIMETIADHYGIPSIQLGLEIARMELDGKLVMKTSAPMTIVSGEELNESAALATDEQGRIIFSKDGVHPYPETGHTLYTRALIRAMEQIQGKAYEHSHSMPEAMDPENWEMAVQEPLSESMLEGPWIKLRPENSKLAAKFEKRLIPLYKLEPGASISFKFKGSKVSLYDLLGPDCGLVEVTIDGKTPQQHKRIDGYSTYHRLSSFFIADGLAPNAIHSVSIRVLDEPLDKKGILLESKHEDFAKDPQKYEGHNWYPGAIFVVGQIVD